MKGKKYLVIATLVVCSVSFISVTVCGISFEEETQLQRYCGSTLKGLKGVCSKVNLFAREGVNLHLVNQKTLQTEVELALRKAGIKVLDDANDFNAGLLLMTITVDKVKELPLYLIGGTTSFHQYVLLIRQPETFTYASTWPLFPSPISYCMGEAIFEERLRDIVHDQTKKFINDYLAANPKEEKKTVKDEQLITGTVRYVQVEGGFYGIVGDNGKKYDPVNLPPEYAKDGLRVKFQVKEMEGMVGTHMWGEIVEVLKIEKLEYQSKNNK